MLAILAEPAAPRCRVAARRRWGEGTRGWGGDGRRGLQWISATSRLRLSQAPFAARDSGPFYWPPWKSHNVVLLGASPANPCLQHAPKKHLVAFGSDARMISMSRSAQAMVAARRGGREHAERRRGGWPHQQRCQATAKNGLGHKANSLDRKCQLLAATLSLI